jgi:uncharacterized protein YbjT (DUF2867 family)
MIVVFGATGKTGGAAARCLLELGEEVRVVGRNRERLQPLVDQGAEPVIADLGDDRATERALAGAEAAYLLIPSNADVADFRGYQRKLIRAATTAVDRSGIGNVVLLSSLGANHSAGTGPFVGLHNYERELRKIPSLKVLSLRAGYFMENLLMSVRMVREGDFLGAPVPPEASMGLIAAADVGRYAALRLAALDFSRFEVVNLVGPDAITMEDVARTIGDAIRRPGLPYMQLSYEDALDGMIWTGLEPKLAELWIQLYQAEDRGLLRPEEGTPVVTTETDFEEFAETTFAAAYREGAAA